MQGVLFDLDGTLVDSYQAITDALNGALRDMALPERTVDEVRRMVGGGVRTLLVRAADDRHADEGVERFFVHYRRTVFDGTVPLPGACEVLEELSRRGYKLGVATNKPTEFARSILEHLGMSRHVGVVVGPEDVAAPKPAPDMLLSACKTLAVDASSCVYVGDMPIDALTAHRAGMPAWLLPTGSSDLDEIREAAPERILQSLPECLDLLEPRT